MTSTRLTYLRLLFLTTLALLMGQADPSYGQQRHPRADVRLYVVVGESYGYIRWVRGGFEAVTAAKKGIVLSYPRDFRYSPREWRIGAHVMGRDPEGQSKELVARDRKTPDADWDNVNEKRGMLLRVPAGPLKGWWVGLGKQRRSKDSRTLHRPLILVKDKKDAAAFTWESPDDDFAP